MKKLILASLTIGLYLIVSEVSLLQAQSASLKCDRSQQYCYTANKRIVIGDTVIFLNEYNELVAVGEIVDVSGVDRKIKITKIYGVITKSTRLRVLLEADVTNLEKAYKVATKDAPAAMGGNAGLGTLNMGSGGFSIVAEGYYDQHWQHGINWVGRGTFLYSSGEVTDYTGYSEKSSYSAFGLLASAGASYKVMRRSLLSFRGEAGLGLGFVNVSSESDAPALDKLKSGIVLFPRFELAAIYNGLAQYKPMIGASYMYLNEASLTTVFIGVTMDVDKAMFFVK